MSSYMQTRTATVRIALAKDGSCLKLFPATPKTPADETFKADEAEAIFATLKAQKMPVSSGSLWLAGMTPDNKKTIQDRKSGKEIEVGHSYSAKQIAEFDAKSFTLKDKLNKFGGSEIVLSAFETEWEPKSRQGNIKRADTATPANPAGNIKRTR